MEHNPLESTGPTAEMPEREVLEQQLRDAEQRRKDMEHRAGEFYDIELYELGTKARQVDPKLVGLFLQASGSSTDQMLANVDKYRAFKKEQLGPIEKEIWDIKEKIRHIDTAKQKAEKAQREEVAQHAYQKEKDALEEKLFNALDAIHSQIPQEARDVGMTTQAAMEAYLPKLVYDADRIEYYMAQLEKVKDERELGWLQEEMKRDNFFK